jgi:hypothetical protein
MLLANGIGNQAIVPTAQTVRRMNGPGPKASIGPIWIAILTPVN